ncbi:PilZ domain-containing protein [Planctomycetota bacterium]
MSNHKSRPTRIEQEAEVVFRVVKNGSDINAAVSSISIGGVFIVTDHEYEEGTILEMDFNVPSRLHKISAKGKIVWTGKKNSRKGVGVEFTEIGQVEVYDLMRGLQDGGWIYALGILAED